MPKAANRGARGHWPVLHSEERGVAGVGRHPGCAALQLLSS